MKSYILKENPPPDQDEWRYQLPTNAQVSLRRDRIVGKLIKFTAEAITLQMNENLPNNRILQTDDPSQFILATFGDLRFPDSSMRVTTDYINRLMKAGFFLNGIQYRFYHHSNSQLRGRSCFLRQAESDAELDARIYKLGSFGKIMNVAKRAKRIGLLFSSAEVDFVLDPRRTTDIDDIMAGDENFSDGCGLMSRGLAVQISRSKKIIFRGNRYTPCVFQIRYLGYKGVLMLHPDLDKETDKEKKPLVQFRSSMKKFSTVENPTFSVVDYSKPYTFGRLNNDIIVLLASLGVSHDKLLAKQQAYFQWIEEALQNTDGAIDFLFCMEKYDLAERVLLDGLDDRAVSQKIRALQVDEVHSFKGKNDKVKSRMMIHKSRLLFGVCDPYRVLKEGQVHIRITSSRKGPATPINGDVLVVRNPCLHPGDCLKLRAVHHPRLSHLVDCIVFASVARPGHHSAPSMSSGGDLDGDKYFVCWDPDLVPSVVSESYDYPPNKERVNKAVTRADLANHFASYNNAGLAKVASLHQKWIRSSPWGALSSECQELNALHSQSVDGARIKIPERLLTPPESDIPYIIDVLGAAAREFSSRFLESHPISEPDLITHSKEHAQELIHSLLGSTQNALSEYEMFGLAFSIARRCLIDFRPYLAHLDLGAFTTQEKYALISAVHLKTEDDPYIWNSLVRSDILTSRDLEQRQLNKVLPLQRLYSSNTNGLATFFQYLRIATQEFTRKVLILKTDDRFAVGVFIRGDVPWDADPEVDDNVVVCSFMPQTSSVMSTYRQCTKGYRLHCSDGKLELYNKQRGDTFIYMNRPIATSGADVSVSIALQKISSRVQKQIGRLNRAPATGIELHVVSNRDRVAHQLFDLYFEHVPTETYVGRFDEEPVPYSLNLLSGFDWGKMPLWFKGLFVPKQSIEQMQGQLTPRSAEELDEIISFCLEYHAEDELFWSFDVMIAALPLSKRVSDWVDRFPPLAFSLLKKYPPDDSHCLNSEVAGMGINIVKNVIRSANTLGIATLVALEKISETISYIPMADYLDLLMLAAHCVRSSNVAQEILLVLNDARIPIISQSDISAYIHKHALAVAFDRAEEAADECPCDEKGTPRKRSSAIPVLRLLLPVANEFTTVVAHVRIDIPNPVRLHSHVRLQAAAGPERGWTEHPVIDGIVVQASKGELKIELQHPPPPEVLKIKWEMFTAGSVATSRAMMDALLRLFDERIDCCSFYQTIISKSSDKSDPGSAEHEELRDEVSIDDSSIEELVQGLNDSQSAAVHSCKGPLSLIWGPPGTGKTTVVVQILSRILRDPTNELKILMSASTHNAVDNVLERFVEINKQDHILEEDKILRVATDHSKVNKALQGYTVDARVGGDMNENNRLTKQAQARVKAATIVFTTCAGAGLGILRKVDFDIVIIDEASQITEPCALIPLVKNCLRAVLVGDQWVSHSFTSSFCLYSIFFHVACSFVRLSGRWPKRWNMMYP